MFPDFRLMIAAVLGSVMALMCGFAVFAAFRVNHEPLARLPSATAPLQLVVGNAAPLPLAIAAAPPTALSMIDAPVHDDGAGGPVAPQAPVVVPEPQTAAAEPEPAAPRVPQPRIAETEPPAPRAAEPSAVAAIDERAAEAPAGEADPAPTGGASSPHPLSPQDQPRQASLPDEEHEAKRTAGLETFAEVSAVADTAATQALPAETAKRESEASHAGAMGNPQSATAHKPARQVEEKRRTRVAARTRRVRRPRSIAVADVGQAGAASQFATAPPSQFQTAPRPADEFASQTNGGRRVKLTSRKPARKRFAVGGPYVRPPQR